MPKSQNVANISPLLSKDVLSAEECDLSGVCVYYIEDDVLVRDATIALLTGYGVIVEPFSSFEDLELAISNLERKPDILVSDFRLPNDKTARDVVSLIRKEFGLDVPVIIMTGEILVIETEGWLEPGKTFRKPVAPETLIREICFSCLR